jgi:hypothetical protein
MNYGTDASLYWLEQHLKSLEEEERDRYRIEIDTDSLYLQAMLEDALSDFSFEPFVDLNEIEDAIISFNKNLNHEGHEGNDALAVLRVAEIDYDKKTGDWDEYGDWYHFAVGAWATTKELMRDI